MIPEAHPARTPISKKSSGEQKLLTLIDFLSLLEQVRNEYSPEKSCDRGELVIEGRNESCLLIGHGGAFQFLTWSATSMFIGVCCG
ncbi:unnamed protein product [Sphagnum balticum]